MTEALHTWALAPAALGACCLAADRRRARVPELAASVLMLLAMLDSSRTHPAVPAVLWAEILLIAAMAVAAVRGRRAATHADADAMPSTGMTLHTNLGLVVMAVLVALMSPHSDGIAHHGPSLGAFVLGAAIASAAYGAASVVAAARTARTRRLDRVQYAAMGISALGMALPLVI
ncbi:MAG TPA: hypothetical protein VNT50_06970 [Microbacterium sp.]|uniref:hypothetical protein n=1 Tax=Microbacterium sp. TaxID=51671 RepID=UPI002B6C17EE|nr:hypothetical protein [Microbacterium sp.]HWI31214.1 hypothetical protein [Microbacterium sp.]